MDGAIEGGIQIANWEYRPGLIYKSVSNKNIQNVSVFDGGAGVEWTGTGTLVDDTVNFKVGSKSIKLTSLNNALSQINKTISLDLSAHTHQFLRFYVDASANIGSIRVQLSNGNFVTGVMEWFTTVSNDGWNEFSVPISSFSLIPGGTFSWSTIDKIRVNCRSKLGTTINVTFDDIHFVKGSPTRPAVIFTFDDGYASVLDVKAVMDKFHMQGVAFIAPNAYINTDGFMTTDQVKSLQDYSGWEIASHGYSHLHMKTLSSDQIEQEVIQALDFFDRNGIVPGPALAYPFGEHNSDVIDVVRKYHPLARGTYNLYTECSYPFLAKYDITGISWDQTTTANDMDALIDNAISQATYSYKSVFVEIIHNAIASPSVSNDCSLSELTTHITNTAGKDIDVLTFGSIANKYGGY